MKKIPMIFKRDFGTGMALDEINPICNWVFEGKGTATRKFDGTCVKIADKKYFKRRMVRKGMTSPKDFIREDFDPITEKSFGWVPVNRDDPNDKYHIEAIDSYNLEELREGTYELCGPNIQGNPEGCSSHSLAEHNFCQDLLSLRKFGDFRRWFIHNEEIGRIYPSMPRTFEEIKTWFKGKDIEGIVFHSSYDENNQMAKIRKKDFGLNRKD